MVTIIRRQRRDTIKGDFVDETLPTLTVKKAARAVTSTPALIGSHYVGVGSPSTVEKVWRITRLGLATGSPETWFAITHSRLGTVDPTRYFPTRGEQLDLGAYDAPLYCFPSGSVSVRVISTGSGVFGFSMEGPEE